MMKAVYRILFFLQLYFFLLLSLACKRKSMLFNHGNVMYSVYCSADEDTVVQFAAAELAKYLGQMSGDTVQVVKDAEVYPVIVVGNRNDLFQAAGEELSLTAVHNDGFRIKALDGNLFISGNISRGTLYGVYYFLDHYLGVRWFAPDFTVVPHKEEFSLPPAIDDLRNPRFAYREMFNGDTDDGLYRQHNLLNGNRFHRAGYQYPAGIDTWADPLEAGHNLQHIIDEAYHYGGQVMMMHDSVRTEAARYLCGRIKEEGTAPWYGLCQEDRGWDPDVASLLFARAHGGKLSAPLLDMVTNVAKRVRQEHPGARLMTYAYQWSFEPPVKMTVPDYVMVEIAPIHADFGYPFDAPQNRDIASAYRRWDSIASTLGTWDYVTNFQNYLQPLPNIYPMCRDIQFLATLPAMKSYFGQGAYTTQGAEFAELRTWVAARLLWNPAQDYQALIKEFVDGYYGPSAPYIMEYLKLLHASLKKSGDRISSKQRITSPYLSLDFVLQADSLMCLAEKMAGEKYAPQVHAVRLGVDMTILLREPEYRVEAEEQGVSWHDDPGRYDRFVSYAEEAGVTDYNEGSSIEDLLQALKIKRKKAGVPDVCKQGEWVDFQDLDFSICCGATLVEDPLASDGGAVRYGGGEWAIQMPLDLLPPGKKWTLFAYVRCEVKEKMSAATVAFRMGLEPGESVAHAVEKVRDGRYHWYRFPGAPVRYQTGCHIWFWPQQGVKNIFVDRLVACEVKN